MAELMIPSWLRISATQPAYASNTAGSESIFTGALRSTESAGDKVKFAISTANASDRENDPHVGLLRAIRGALRGFGGRVWYTPAGYNIRGSFPSGELLSNNTFANGTTGWTNSEDTSLSVQDRILRATRTAVTAKTFAPIPTAASTVVQYAPYVARFFISGKRGASPSGFSITEGVSPFTRYSSVAQQGMVTAAIVYSSTSLRVGLLDESSSGVIAGDYNEVSYASLSRCALVDNGTNLLLQSDELDTTWIATRSSVDDQTAGTTAPDGTSTADSIIEDSTAASTHQIGQNVTVSSAAADYAFSVAVKAGARTWCRIFMVESTGTTSVDAFFNLSTGAVGTTATGANWSNLRTFSRPLGNGWHVLSIVARKTSAATIISANIGLATADNTASYSGDGTSNIYAWRGTLAQSSVPTRLVATTTTALASGALQTGSGIHLKGLPASVSGLLRYGAWIQTGKQLGMVITRLDSDAAGLGYLQLAYPPRTPPPDNDPIIVHEPMGRFYSMDAEARWSERPGVFSDHDWQLCEALDS